MKKKSRFIPILVLTLMMTILTACTKIEDNRSNIERIRMTSEYLNVLGAFNSVSREFSRAAKLMQESDRRMNQSFDNAFWSEYDEKRSKAEREMRAIKQYQFEFEPFADLKTDLQTMTACME